MALALAVQVAAVTYHFVEVCCLGCRLINILSCLLLSTTCAVESVECGIAFKHTRVAWDGSVVRMVGKEPSELSDAMGSSEMRISSSRQWHG